MKESKYVKAFHLRFGSHELMGPFKKFIESVLVPKGINCLIVECNTSFQFTSHPEITDGTLTKEDAKDLALLCKRHDIRLIPLFQCLGHQGWGGARNSILRHYPEYDETPHIPIDAEWPAFFAPSWCPLHPDVNTLVFDLLDDLTEAFESDAIHVGMDEVFALADDKCPRCRGKDRAVLFAKAVNDIHEHVVTKRGLDMFMWGDRLIDNEVTGYNNKWEADIFGTHKAIDNIPKDIKIMDWHYENHESFPSTGMFLKKGFTVFPACWFKTEAAVNFLHESRQVAKEQGTENRMAGMIVTSWHHWDEKAFESFSEQTLDGEMKELYQTLDTITRKLQ